MKNRHILRGNPGKLSITGWLLMAMLTYQRDPKGSIEQHLQIFSGRKGVGDCGSGRYRREWEDL